MIQIDKFAKRKNTGGSSSEITTATGFTKTVITDTELETHRLWGQEFNGTQDVTGDLTGVGGIEATGDITTTENITCEGLSVLDSANINDITSHNIDSEGFHSDEGTIDTFNSTTANITSLTVEDLTARLAHFLELTIDEVKSIGGQVIITAANATIDKVIPRGDGSYLCYFLATDGNKKISNDFQVGDRVLCSSFNIASGDSYNISNKFYWVGVSGKLDSPMTVDGEVYHAVILDFSLSTLYRGDGRPEAGDQIVQFGNNNDTSRQNAIVLSAYNNQYLDPLITAPSIVQYSGINDFNLANHRLNVISAAGNSFRGDFTTETGEDLLTIIQAKADDIILRVKNVGINIDENTITLSGNTDINGTLTLTDSDQGFVLVGTEGITQISPQSIGTYSNFRGRSSTTVSMRAMDNQPGFETLQTYYEFNFTNSFNIGTVKSGKTITIIPGTRTYYTFDGHPISQYSEQKSYKILEGGTQQATGNITGNSFTYTSAGGNITVQLITTTTISGSYFDDEVEEGVTAIPMANLYYNASFSIPNDAYMLIGYDGLAINFGTSATAYFGAESSTFYYGNYGLQISSSGIKRWTGSAWKNIYEKNVTTFSANYTLQDTDDVLIFQGSSNATLTLGTAETGRIIYVKDRGSGRLTLSGTIYSQNSRSTSTSIDLSDTMVFLIYFGGWNLGYCG